MTAKAYIIRIYTDKVKFRNLVLMAYIALPGLKKDRKKKKINTDYKDAKNLKKKKNLFGPENLFKFKQNFTH